jgi:hypothetical protein
MANQTDPKAGDDDHGRADRELGANARRIEEFLKRNAELGLDAQVSKKYLGLAGDLLSDSIPNRLDPAIRREIEQVVGFDTSHVRVHVGEKAQQAADALNARAFALGDSDVYFGRGEFQPGTAAGKALLAHELTHVFEATQPVALATKESIAESGLRPGEDTATRAEQEMYRQATTMQDEQDDKSLEYKELTAAERVLLEEKIWKILQERQRARHERLGRG